MSTKPELELVLKGPEQSPTTVDPVATLDFALAYFELLRRIAKEQEVDLQFRGLDIREGSMIIASHPLRPDLAIAMMRDAARYVGGTLEPPPELEKRVREVRSRVKDLPLDVVATTRCEGYEVALTPDLRKETLPPREFVELRATVMTVGGSGTPYARFRSKSEERAFTLKTDETTAVRLAKLLYASVDLTGEVQRDEKGHIHSGILRDFVAVDVHVDQVKVWRDWFRDAGGDWNDLDDVDDGEELERV